MNSKFLSKNGFMYFEIVFYSFFLLAIILASLRINEEFNKKRIIRIRGLFDDFAKN